MQYTPLVSIVIPVYNGKKYMQTAIDSALAQTYKNIEVIVINDGSPDDGETERIALSYGDAIRYFCKENGGCASALNFGISKMKGEWFSWLSHDDVYMPEKIEKEILCINKNRLDHNNTIISCDSKIINQNGDIILHPPTTDSGYFEGEYFVKRLLFGASLNGCGLLIPKSLLTRVGCFSSKYKFLLDWQYWLRIALSDGSLYRLNNQPLVMNRVHSGQVTVRAIGHYAEEMQEVLDELFPMAVKTGNTDIMSSFYTFSVAAGQKNMQKKWMSELKRTNAFSIKLQLKGKMLKFKKAIRKLVANCYWKFVRWHK